MINCPSEQDLSAYHDRELSADRLASIADHLAACDACARVLARLGRLSGRFAQESRISLSAMSLARLHAGLDRSMQSGLRRLAWMLSGVAASIVVAGLVGLHGLSNAGSAQTPAPPPPWVAASVASNRDPAVRTASSPAAQWYLADASDSGDEAQ